jgi:hypothetical protein
LANEALNVDGQKTGEVEIIEFKAVDKTDEKTFAKPE